MMQATTDPIQIIIEEFLKFWNTWSPWIIPVIELVLIWIVLIIIAGVITRFLRRRAARLGIPPNAVNGVILAIRLLFLWIGIVVFAAFVPPLWENAITIVGGASLLIGAAVGLAIGQAMRNFIAGLYVMFSNPFDVGDYVRIAKTEGIVLEISINYTKIRQADGSIALIPNNNVMNSSVTNFRFERKPKSLVKAGQEETVEEASLPRRIWKSISKVIDTSKLIQYTFDLRFPVNEKTEKYDTTFSELCKRWKRKFGYQPVYALTNFSHLAFTYSFTIFVDDPKILLELKSDFIEDIAKSVY